MKTLQVEILLYHPEKPQELRVDLRIPVFNVTAKRLLTAQANGTTIYEQTALYQLAGAVGGLNGLRGMPLRVREVDA